MAIIKCPDCGGKVSDKANACIHCGRPMCDSTYDKIMKGRKLLKEYEDGLNIYAKEEEFNLMKVTFPLFW